MPRAAVGAWALAHRRLAESRSAGLKSINAIPAALNNGAPVADPLS